jgi:DNA-directed RNA polymerase specialized sigma subunit
MLRTQAESCTSRPKEINIQTNRNLESKQEQVVPRLEESIAKLETKCAEWSERLVKIYQAIEILDEREKRLIILKYVDCMKWEEVCVEIGYEWAQTHRIHSDALIKLKHDTQ